MSVQSASGGERADLAQLARLAEEGRTRPLLGGRTFLLYGGAIALASALHAAIAARVLPLPPIAIAVVWFGLTGGAALIAGRWRRQRPALGGNRVEREVWRAGGAVLGSLALAILIFAYATLARTGSADGFALFAVLPPVTFGVYAIALNASAAAARADYLRPYAVIAIGFLFLTTLLANSLWQFAAMALGVGVVSILPGLALLRRERAHG